MSDGAGNENRRHASEPLSRRMLTSKIHRARVTAANIDYEGSVTIDQDLLEAADICEFEQVHIWNVTSGARLVTYAMQGDRGSGEICVNGAAARLAGAGDIIIIATFSDIPGEAVSSHQPKIVLLDERNRITDSAAREIAGPRVRSSGAQTGEKTGPRRV